MKRKGGHDNNQPLTKRPDIVSTSSAFRSKIAAKLQTLLEGIATEPKNNFTEDKKPDISSLFDGSSDFPVTPSVDTENSFTDSTSLALQNFINSAKLKITELLHKENNEAHAVEIQNDFDCNQGCSVENGHEATQSTLNGRHIGPLQRHISVKLHNLLGKALNKNVANSNLRSQSGENGHSVLSEGELEDLSLLFQEFINSLKRQSNISKKHVTAPLRNQQFCSPNATLISHRTSEVKQSDNNKQSNNRKKHLATEINHHGKDIDQNQSNHLCTVSVKKSSKPGTSSKMICSDDSNTEWPSERCSDDELECRELNIFGVGTRIISLSDCEYTPEVLDLNVRTDSSENDSEPDVIVLGEKRPVYEVITLEEDDRAESDVEEQFFNCQQCGKRFRAESLLKFHLRMHGSEPSLNESAEFPPVSNSNRVCNEEESSSSSSERSADVREKSIPKICTKSSDSYRLKLRRKKRAVRRRHKTPSS